MKPKKKARRETRRMSNKPLNRKLRAARATKQDELSSRAARIKMAREGSVKYLNTAKSNKNDEFYTILSDIERELKHYKKHFKNKTVLCNCDDPKVSNFFVYFSLNFEQLGLKKLITTCYKNCDADLFSKHTAENGIYLEYDGDKNDNRVPDPDEIGIHTITYKEIFKLIKANKLWIGTGRCAKTGISK